MRWIVAGTHSLDSVIRVSTYHLVRYLAENPALAEDGSSERNQILYMPAPISPLHALLRPDDARYLERKPLAGKLPVRWSENVWQYAPKTLLPVLQQAPFRSRWAHRHSLSLTVPSLRRVLGEADFLECDLLMITNLQYANLDRIVRAKRLIYRCVDDIRGFVSAPRSLARAEEKLLERCDVCFATSVSLAEKLRQRGGRNVHVVRHGVDSSASANLGALAEPVDLNGIPHPRVVYVGTLSDWFHMDYVKIAAERLPGHHFVLIGPKENASIQIPNMANIHYLGPRKPEDIPKYLAHCDAAMIPFRISPLVESVLPLKLYEYLAAGLPVVATRWRELELAGAPIGLAETSEEFADMVRTADRNGGRIERLVFAGENTWEKQFGRMMEILESG